MSQTINQEQLQTMHRSVNIDGLDIFYREAGSAAAPTILLLHGFPTFISYVPRPDSTVGGSIPPGGS